METTQPVRWLKNDIRLNYSVTDRPLQKSCVSSETHSQNYTQSLARISSCSLPTNHLCIVTAPWYMDECRLLAEARQYSEICQHIHPQHWEEQELTNKKILIPPLEKWYVYAKHHYFTAFCSLYSSSLSSLPHHLFLLLRPLCSQIWVPLLASYTSSSQDYASSL